MLSLPSYNPFDDEDDTGSTVSEKEDTKAKKLVNTSHSGFHLARSLTRSLALFSPSSLARHSPS